jgi:hypothetical protein
MGEVGVWLGIAGMVAFCLPWLLAFPLEYLDLGDWNEWLISAGMIVGPMLLLAGFGLAWIAYLEAIKGR